MQHTGLKRALAYLCNPVLGRTQLTGEWEAFDMGRRLLPTRQIAAMRYYYSKGHRIAELAEHFGVHESVASNICHGRTHHRVPPAEDLPPGGVWLTAGTVA